MCFLRFTTLRRIFPVAAVLALSSLAQADTLDQSNDEGAIEYFISDLNDVAQSFTVGITGQLTEIEVFVGRQSSATMNDLTLELRTMDGAFPSEPDVGSNILATLTKPSGDVNVSDAGLSSDGDWESFDLTPLDIDVTSGDTLAIVLLNGAAEEYYWYGQDSDSYAGGSVFLRVGGASNWVDDPFDKTVDLGFRTYVEAIPEPSSIAVISVLAGLGFVRRRRK